MNEDNFVLSKRSILLLLTANLKYFDFVLSKRSILLFLTAKLKYFKTVESRLRCNNNENLHILTMLELLSGIFLGVHDNLHKVKQRSGNQNGKLRSWQGLTAECVVGEARLFTVRHQRRRQAGLQRVL